MNKLKTLATFGLGMATTVALSATPLTAFAAGVMEDITVLMGGISIMVDGDLKIPTDVNGNVVEPIVYDGTTYLPLRAVVGMLSDKAVNWDGDTQTVYIGDVPENAGKTIVMDELKDYQGDTAFYSPEYGENMLSFEVLGDTFTTFNRLKYSGYTFDLDSQYSTLQGSMVMQYSTLGATGTGTIQFINVDRYGTETVLKEFSTEVGDEPLDFRVNVAGCNFLKIKYFESNDYNAYPVCYDFTLTQSA